VQVDLRRTSCASVAASDLDLANHLAQQPLGDSHVVEPAGDNLDVGGLLV
jgi:hypothetical protein